MNPLKQEASREEKCPTDQQECPWCGSTEKAVIRCQWCGGAHEPLRPHEICTNIFHKGSATAPKKIVIGATDDGFEYANVPESAPPVETPKEKTMTNDNEVNELGYPLWPVDSSGTLVLTISIRIDDATKADRGVMNDPLIGAITEALKPLFSNLPCVNLIEEKP